MISDFFINMGFAFALAFDFWGLDNIVPEWLAIDALVLAQVFGMMGSMSVWFPVPLVLVVVGAVIVSWFTGFGIKFFRVIASHVPFIGGNG